MTLADVTVLADCESVENRCFAEVLGDPVCQLCARFSSSFYLPSTSIISQLGQTLCPWAANC
jgi:hypothetical protein